MRAARALWTFAAPSFRVKLLVAMMVVVSGATALTLLIAQGNVAASAEADLQRDFQRELAALHAVEAVRHAALAERCRVLVRKPRLRAALEDNALDLLYPSARDELLDVIRPEEPGDGRAAQVVRARFYRFLDRSGRVIAPDDANDAGRLRAEEEAQLALPRAAETTQIGYIFRRGDDGARMVDELMAMPIVSSETGEVIAALVLGFKPAEFGLPRVSEDIRSGLWLNGRLHLPALADGPREELEAKVERAIASEGGGGNSFPVTIDGEQHLLFFKQLNAGSLFPPAYEVCISPLTASLARQRQLLWRFVVAGVLLLGAAYFVSNIVSFRLSVPVAKLAVDSEVNRAQRQRAEAALELTNEELQRSVRFSADASHQLKTPVTVLRAGLEELLATEKLAADVREELSGLVHQTLRLTTVIEDLLLLSRLDAGRLRLKFGPVNLSRLIEAWLDDLWALPDPLQLKVGTEFRAEIFIAGEECYTAMIVQNLLENSRKYNRTGGRIWITVREEGEVVVLAIGNTGAAIPKEMQAHLFDRFHRGAVGENIPGHGLGLNLAHELARLHQGELRLAVSSEDWTQFEVRFRRAEAGGVGG